MAATYVRYVPSEGWAWQGVHWPYVGLVEERLVTITHRGEHILNWRKVEVMQKDLDKESYQWN